MKAVMLCVLELVLKLLEPVNRSLRYQAAPTALQVPGTMMLQLELPPFELPPFEPPLPYNEQIFQRQRSIDEESALPAEKLFVPESTPIR